MKPTRSSEALANKIWEAVLEVAELSGLDPKKYGTDHQEIVGRVATFLTTDPLQADKKAVENYLINAPIIICGVPGTGKTTFLYVLDKVLRNWFDLPDPIHPTMHNKHGRTLHVPKRKFCGTDVSLLSVRKWTELLHFYAWDTNEHRFDRSDLSDFLKGTLRPMRIAFADEVEMAGYSPTLPDLTDHGLLVIGTSNQYQFKQLDQAHTPPKIYRFEGEDLRAGDPTDAVVVPGDAGWALFDTVDVEPSRSAEFLDYKTYKSDDLFAVSTDFYRAIQAPMHETQWVEFLTQAWAASNPGEDDVGDPIRADSKYVLLLDRFSLENLRTDWNAIIRFVWLFDAIEQLGIGVMIRDLDKPAVLSREAMDHMKVTIHTARGVTEEVRARTLVGIGRVTSRIGMAGVRAHAIVSGS